MTPIRVLIVEDSAVVREHLRRIISADPRLDVAGLAATGEEALAMVHTTAPDVISLDVRLPGMQGFEVSRRIMAERPTPIVIVSGMASEEVNLTMEALNAGALSVVEKPVAATHEDYQALASRLCTQLVIMSQVKVIRQRPLAPAAPAPPAAPRCAGPYRAVAVAASTGGPAALMKVLSALRSGGCQLPIALVQHMTPGFVTGFASWLGNVTGFDVRIIEARTRMLPGNVYLPAPERHLLSDCEWAWTGEDSASSVHRPSADVLFSCIARTAPCAAIAVLLTGMGEDGASGLRQLRFAGGYTIAEDPSTAVVYGMPAAAVRAGAVRESLPLDGIAPRVLQLIASDRGTI